MGESHRYFLSGPIAKPIKVYRGKAVIEIANLRDILFL